MSVEQMPQDKNKLLNERPKMSQSLKMIYCIFPLGIMLHHILMMLICTLIYLYYIEKGEGGGGSFWWTTSKHVQ